MMPIIQIPYGNIGTIVAIVLIVLAFFHADINGRIIILSLSGLTFLLPRLFPSPTLHVICWAARLFIGMGSYIYLKYIIVMR
jgi:hypothetical protein